jgi:hypothetical protein
VRSKISASAKKRVASTSQTHNPISKGWPQSTRSSPGYASLSACRCASGSIEYLTAFAWSHNGDGADRSATRATRELSNGTPARNRVARLAPFASGRDVCTVHIRRNLGRPNERKIKPNKATTTKPRSPETARSEAPGPPSSTRLAAAVRSSLNGRPLPFIAGRTGPTSQGSVLLDNLESRYA